MEEGKEWFDSEEMLQGKGGAGCQKSLDDVDIYLESTAWLTVTLSDLKGQIQGQILKVYILQRSPSHPYVMGRYLLHYVSLWVT